jgi:hypothetical protein
LVGIAPENRGGPAWRQSLVLVHETRDERRGAEFLSRIIAFMQ